MKKKTDSPSLVKRYLRDATLIGLSATAGSAGTYFATKVSDKKDIPGFTQEPDDHTKHDQERSDSRDLRALEAEHTLIQESDKRNVIARINDAITYIDHLEGIVSAGELPQLKADLSNHFKGKDDQQWQTCLDQVEALQGFYEANNIKNAGELLLPLKNQVRNGEMSKETVEKINEWIPLAEKVISARKQEMWANFTEGNFNDYTEIAAQHLTRVKRAVSFLTQAEKVTSAER